MRTHHKSLEQKLLGQVVWSTQMPAAVIVQSNKTFKFLGMLMIDYCLAGFLMLVYLSETGLPLVAPLPFWSPLAYKIQIAYHSSFAPSITPKPT